MDKYSANLVCKTKLRITLMRNVYLLVHDLAQVNKAIERVGLWVQSNKNIHLLLISPGPESLKIYCWLGSLLLFEGISKYLLNDYTSSELDRSQEVETAVLSCESEATWQHGNSLINYMKLVKIIPTFISYLTMFNKF